MSRVAKIFQYTKTKPRVCWHGGLTGVYLSWPSNPLIASPPKSRIPLDYPLKVPNLDRSLYESLSLLESTYYLIAPKQRDERRWRPWITKIEKVDTTTWRVLSPTLGVDDLLQPVPTVLGELGRPSDYLIKELAKSYILVQEDGDNKQEMKAHKVLPLYNQGDQHVQLLALKWDGSLGLLNEGQENWTNIIPENGDGAFVDIAAYHGRFYATDRNDGLYIIDGNISRLVTKASDHAIFNNFTNDERVYSTSNLSLLEYDGQLCLLKFKKFSEEKVVMAHRRGGDDEQNWEVTKSLRNKILFKMNEACFALPAHLLDRKFQGDWICYCDDVEEQRDPGWVGMNIEGVAEFEKGLLPLERIAYDRYQYSFDKCSLDSDINRNPYNETSFRSLPDEEYISLFFTPPPWIQYYCLDPHQGFPPVRFDKAYLPKYDFDYKS